MHRSLPRESEVLQNIELAGSIENAWRLVTDPNHMMSWMGLQFQCLELELKPGGKIVFADTDGNVKLKRYGIVTECFPPYKFAYRYNQQGASLTQHANLVIISLMVLPQNHCMVNVHETGFSSSAEFDSASAYWRKALVNLQKIMPI